jgi:hypothetical protein
MPNYFTYGHVVVTPADERFWSFVDLDGPIPEYCPDLGPCWLWTAHLSHGYGCIVVDGKRIRAHRFSWELHYGPVPDGLFVLHNCHLAHCVNPIHLYVGTQSQNVRDQYESGRRKPRIERCRCNPATRRVGHSSRKLTDHQVVAIRARLEIGERTRVIARDYGVDPATIRNVRSGKCYSTEPHCGLHT